MDANLQPSMPEIDANLIGKKIQYNFEMDVIELGEVTQKKTLRWFTGEVLEMKDTRIFYIEWDKEGEESSEVELKPFNWNKEKEHGWRMFVVKKIIDMQSSSSESESESDGERDSESNSE